MHMSTLVCLSMCMRTHPCRCESLCTSSQPWVYFCVSVHVQLNREQEPRPAHGLGSGLSSRAFLQVVKVYKDHLVVSSSYLL